MGFMRNAGNAPTLNEGEMRDLNDMSLIFLFQNKIFNAIMEEDTQRALKGVFLLDAHLEPYKNKWRDKEVVLKKTGEKKMSRGYKTRLDELRKKYANMVRTHTQEIQVEGKSVSVPISADEAEFIRAVEWYRLERRLMEKAGFLPKDWVDIDA